MRSSSRLRTARTAATACVASEARQTSAVISVANASRDNGSIDFASSATALGARMSRSVT